MTKLAGIDEEFQAQVNARIQGLQHLANAYVYGELASTNDQAHLLEQEHVPSGTLVLAACQTQGRGRLNRRWLMAEGDIALSVIIRPPFLPRTMSLLPMLPALAMVKGLGQQGITAWLKWPNDIVIEGQRGEHHPYLAHYRKVGGILIENVFRANAMAASIVGIGLNIVPNPKLYEAVPYAASLGQTYPQIDRIACLGAFLVCFDKQLIQAVHDERLVVETYAQHCVTLGRKVQIQIQDRSIRGIATTIRHDGSLVVNDGSQDHIVCAGDVVGV